MKSNQLSTLALAVKELESIVHLRLGKVDILDDETKEMQVQIIIFIRDEGKK